MCDSQPLLNGVVVYCMERAHRHTSLICVASCLLISRLHDKQAIRAEGSGAEGGGGGGAGGTDGRCEVEEKSRGVRGVCVGGGQAGGVRRLGPLGTPRSQPC